MKCARCGADASKASWFCDNCGSRLGEVNLALTIGSPPPRRRGRRWLGLAVLALVAVLGLAVFAQRSALRSGVATLTEAIRADGPAASGAGGSQEADGDRTEGLEAPAGSGSIEAAAETAMASAPEARPDLVTPTAGTATGDRELGRADSQARAKTVAPSSTAGSDSAADGPAGAPSGQSRTGSVAQLPTDERAPAPRAPGQGPVSRGQSSGSAGESSANPVGTPRGPAPTATGRRASGGDARPPAEAALTPTAVSGRVRPNAPVWVAGPNPAFVLDGWLDDWHYDGMPVNQRVFGEEHWDGPADLSAQAFVAWSDTGLLFGARVIDDIVSAPATGADLYLGDGLELQIDTELLSDWGATEYDADDWQIGLSPGDLASRPPEAHVWRPEGVDPVGIRVEAQRTNDGYILEGVIPWRLLGLSASAVDRLGFSFNVSDNDLQEPAQLTMLASAPNRSWSDPTTFGTLLIER